MPLAVRTLSNFNQQVFFIFRLATMLRNVFRWLPQQEHQTSLPFRRRKDFSEDNQVQEKFFEQKRHTLYIAFPFFASWWYQSFCWL
jgi:2-polyprenyl-3-methyl-5-hydroxy-6-metoxy-1,4-benzoquinol methylase